MQRIKAVYLFQTIFLMRASVKEKIYIFAPQVISPCMSALKCPAQQRPLKKVSLATIRTRKKLAQNYRIFILMYRKELTLNANKCSVEHNISNGAQIRSVQMGEWSMHSCMTEHQFSKMCDRGYGQSVVSYTGVHCIFQI